MRKAVSPRTDQEIFRRTATNTKVINLGPRIYRGGTRL